MTTAILIFFILSFPAIFCRPSDFARQDLNDWKDFTALNDFSSAEKQAWDDIGNDINSLGNGNTPIRDFQKQQVEEGQLNAGDIDEVDSKESTDIYDPCYGVKCKEGQMCIVADTTTNETTCVCPKECPNIQAPICTTLGIQYNSTCHAHKDHCRTGKTFSIAYNEACIAKQGPCTESELSQFPIRFLEWMMHVRETDVLGDVDPNSSVRRLTDHERFTVSKWMYKRVDLEHDQLLQSYDLKLLMHQLLPVEHCIDEFLKECDIDQSGDLTVQEWNNCLMPGTNSVENDFFENQ